MPASAQGVGGRGRGGSHHGSLDDSGSGYTYGVRRHLAETGTVGNGSNVRLPSVPVRHNGPASVPTHKSGYHEVNPTSSQLYLRNTPPGGRPAGNASEHGGPHGMYTKHSAEEQLRGSESARTDTALTLLAYPSSNGVGIAGHSGSGVDMTGQAAAHDLLRQTYADALKRGLNAQETAVLSGALALASMPPRLHLEKLKVYTGGAVDPTLVTHLDWRRADMKGRVNEAFEQLGEGGRTAVAAVIGETYRKLNENLPSNDALRRTLLPNHVTTPRRASVSHDGTGGAYLSPAVAEEQTGKTYVDAAKTHLDPHRAAYMTAPFRGDRN